MEDRGPRLVRLPIMDLGNLHYGPRRISAQGRTGGQ